MSLAYMLELWFITAETHFIFDKIKFILVDIGIYHLVTCLSAKNSIFAYISVEPCNEGDYLITVEAIAIAIREVQDRLKAICGGI